MENKTQSAEDIINYHVKWAMGAGMVPLPIVDFFAVGSIQLAMIKQLSNLYGIEFKESHTQSIIASVSSAAMSKIATRAVKFIPGIGTILGGITMSAMSGASTYAIGQLFKSHFEKGGDIPDINMEQLKAKYNELFEKGKSFIEKWKPTFQTQQSSPQQSPSPKEEVIQNEAFVANNNNKRSIVDQLKDIVDLKEKGLLSEEEFSHFKKKILDQA